MPTGATTIQMLHLWIECFFVHYLRNNLFNIVIQKNDKKKEIGDTYQDTFRRHRWSAQMTMKKDN
jgi:hypothetical protein